MHTTELILLIIVITVLIVAAVFALSGLYQLDKIGNKSSRVSNATWALLVVAIGGFGLFLFLQFYFIKGAGNHSAGNKGTTDKAAPKWFTAFAMISTMILGIFAVWASVEITNDSSDSADQAREMSAHTYAMIAAILLWVTAGFLIAKLIYGLVKNKSNKSVTFDGGVPRFETQTETLQRQAADLQTKAQEHEIRTQEARVKTEANVRARLAREQAIRQHEEAKQRHEQAVNEYQRVTGEPKPPNRVSLHVEDTGQQASLAQQQATYNEIARAGIDPTSLENRGVDINNPPLTYGL